MQGPKRWLESGKTTVLVALMAAAGCTSHVSNLTPTGLPREESGLYHFETQWDTNQRSVGLRSADIKAYVVIDQQMHPMQRVPNMTNRWEADIVITNRAAPIYYFYKWDYPTAGWGHDNLNSRRSQQYRLELQDPLPTPEAGR